MNNEIKNSKNFADGDAAHILLKWGVTIKCYKG